MQILTGTLVVVAGLGVSYAAAVAFGGWRWSAAIRDMVLRLDEGRVTPNSNR